MVSVSMSVGNKDDLIVVFNNKAEAIRPSHLNVSIGLRVKCVCKSPVFLEAS